MNIKEITDADRERKRLEAAKAPLDTYEDDPCCSKLLAKALRVNPAITTWTCPKCGCDWMPVTIGQVRHWEPQILMELL